MGGSATFRRCRCTSSRRSWPPFGPPKLEQQVLFEALAGKQAEIDRFLGVITGAVPLRDYLTPGNLRKVIGVRGVAKVMLSRLRRSPGQVRGGTEGALYG
jgi:hypothetical protein